MIRLARRLRDEEGQALVTVVLMTMLIMALVVAATTITASQAVPARRSVDQAAALAAAQGGIQDFLATISRECPTAECSWATGEGAAGGGTLGDGDASFAWEVLQVDGNAVRVRSTGTHEGGSGATRTLVADVVGGAQLTDYMYYSTYETQPSDLIAAQNPAREIPLPNAAGWPYVNRPGSSVVWDGAGAYVGELPHADTCDRLWYGDGASDSRSKAREPADGAAEWGETGTIGGSGIERGGTCDVMFSSGSEMFGAVYSKDAFLISSSTVGGSGPMFHDLVETEWDEQAEPAADLAKNYRVFDLLQQSEPAIGSRVPTVARTTINLPVWAAPEDATCIYTGPTRVVIDGGELVITSPLTDPAAGACYTSDPTDAAITEYDGVYEARVPATGTTIFVEDAPGSADEALAPQSADAEREPDNALFWAQTARSETTTVTGVAFDEVDERIVRGDIDEAMTPGDEELFAQRFANVLTNLGRSLAEFDEEWDEFLDDVDAEVEAALPADVAGRASADLAATLDNAVAEVFDEADATRDFGRVTCVTVVCTEGTRNLTYDIAPAITADAPSIRTPDSAPAITETSNDGFTSTTDELRTFTDTTVDSATLTVSLEDRSGSTPVTRPQFELTVERTVTETGEVSVTTRAFPLPGDRNTYSRTAGDIYVEGALDGSVSLVAENDIVVTGDVTHASGSTVHNDQNIEEFASADALALVAQENVLIYHPIACRNTDETAIAATTPGFCPDDITGLYTGGIPRADFDVMHPSMQYANLASPVARIDAAIFALGGALALDAHDKAPALDTLAINGAVYQEHRGATGVEWEIRSSSSTRPRSGYDLAYRYDGGLPAKHFPFVPGSDAPSAGQWTVTGVTENLTEGDS